MWSTPFSCLILTLTSFHSLCMNSKKRTTSVGKMWQCCGVTEVCRQTIDWNKLRLYSYILLSIKNALYISVYNKVCQAFYITFDYKKDIFIYNLRLPMSLSCEGPVGVCMFVCVCVCVCFYNSPFNPLWGFSSSRVRAGVSLGIWQSETQRTVLCGSWGSGMCSALPQQCPQSVPAPPHPPGGPGSFQDEGVSADAAGGLEGGGASVAASDCAASDCAASGWLLEGFGASMEALGGAGWGWLTWTESCGSCWATAAGLARMSCGVGRPAVRWTVGAVAAGLAAACANCVATGLAWMSCVMWPDGLPCMSVASWLAGMVMMVIFSPALEPAGSIVGRAWMTSLGGALAEALPIVTGTPVVRMEEEFNVTWPNELVMTSGMARMGLQEEAQKGGVTSLLCTARLHHGRRIRSLIYMTGHILTCHRWKYEMNDG